MQLFSGIAQARAIRAEGDAANQYYNYQAKVAEQNAILAERTGKAQAQAIQDTQAIQGRQLKESNVEFRASQSAALAASGIPLSSVTAGDIQRSTVSKQALDESLLRYNADVRSWEALTGAQNQAYGYRANASNLRASGAQAKYASQLQARSTLIGSAFSAGTSLLSPLTSSFRFLPGAGFGFTRPLTGYGLGAPAGVINTGRVSILPRR
jgi:hypothetical protein